MDWTPPRVEAEGLGSLAAGNVPVLRSPALPEVATAARVALQPVPALLNAEQGTVPRSMVGFPAAPSPFVTVSLLDPAVIVRGEVSAPPLTATMPVPAGAGPVAPVAPVGPVAPVAPVAPLLPAGPVAPVDPVVPVAPGAPSAPAGPVNPISPCGPVAPVAPVAPSAPAGP
jgi:hypothetical protein